MTIQNRSLKKENKQYRWKINKMGKKSRTFTHGNKREREREVCKTKRSAMRTVHIIDEDQENLFLQGKLLWV